MKQSRKKAREAAFTQVFQIPTHRDNMDEIRGYLLQDVPACEQNIGYITDITEGVMEHEEEIIEIINSNLKGGWNFKRLSKMARSLLLIAIYEMKYCDDVPAKVAINEAVELAKRYCDEQEPAFINGILGGVMKSL